MPRKNAQKPKKPHHWIEIGVALASLAAIIFIAFRPTFAGSTLNAQNAAQFGDFIGGFLGTILLIVSGCLVISAYRLQNFAEQVRSFEAHFFEMLKYHRDNMMEIDVDGIKGRRAFVSFIREWRLALDIVDKSAAQSGHELQVEDRARLAYFAFFHGSGPNARNDLLRSASKYPKDLVEELIEVMSCVWKEASKVPTFSERLLKKLGLISSQRCASNNSKNLAYIPFEGHHSRLAHYFRHLYQIVRHVDKTAPEGTEQDHIDLVRAQLSTHEQALLALHAYAVRDPWIDSQYIDKYGLIQDLPDGFLNPSEFPVAKIFKQTARSATTTTSGPPNHEQREVPTGILTTIQNHQPSDDGNRGRAAEAEDSLPPTPPQK